MKFEDQDRKLSFQATEEILLILEKSKKESDKSIDRLPGIYIVMDEEGHIFRANENFLSLINKKIGLTQAPLFFEYLSQDDKNSFLSQLNLAKANRGKNYNLEISFKIESQPTVEFSISFFCWNIKRTSEDLVLFTLVGRDVSELKEVSLLKDRLQKELVAAEQVQNIMLPVDDVRHKNIEISCFYRAAAECGGDFLHYTVTDDRVLIWAGDVTGHGLGPAMVTGAVRGAVSVLERQKKVDLEQWMNDLNRCVHEISKNKYWMTFQIAEFDLKSKMLRVCQAGHTAVYRLDLRGIVKATHWRDFTTVLPESSHALGSSHKPKFHTYEEKLKNDCLYMSFSDGIIEATDPEKRQFGLRKTFQSVCESLNKGQGLSLMKDQLIKDVQLFTNYQPLEDDFSIWSLIVHSE